jgi:hypothetical protein
MPDVRMSDSDTALKKVIKTYLDKVASELALIREQEYADEIIVEYRKLPDLTTAMRSVQERHRQLDELEKRKAEREAREAAEREARAKVAQAVTRQDAAAPEPEPPEAFTPPVAAAEPAQSDPLMRVAFTVTGRRSALRALKQYILSDGGLKIE